MIERIIHKTFQKYSIPMQAINNNVREQFKSKIWRMGKRYFTFGGPGREKQLKLWKVGPCLMSTWVLTVDITYLHNNLQSEHDELKLQQGQLTNKIIDLQREKEQQQEHTNELQSQLTTIQQITHEVLTGDKHVHNARKPWQEYTPKHQILKKKKLSNEITAVLKICDNSIFTPTKVHIKNKESNEDLILDLQSQKYMQ